MRIISHQVYGTQPLRQINMGLPAKSEHPIRYKPNSYKGKTFKPSEDFQDPLIAHVEAQLQNSTGDFGNIDLS